MEDRITGHRVGLVLLAAALGILTALMVLMVPTGLYGLDVGSYLAAGERLNAGHPLYQISPGDRPVFLKPPYWTTPLVSPPTIAALWRPLAALPYELGAYAWWIASLTSFVAAIAMLWRKQPVLTSLALLILIVPTANEIGVGNINSMILLGLVLTWRAWTRNEEKQAGFISGVMAAVKLTPAVTLWWLLVTGSRRAFVVGALTLTGILTLGLIGAGAQAHLDYVTMLRTPASMTVYPESLGGMAMSWGLPERWAGLVPWLAALTGLFLVWALRSRPSWSFGVAVLTTVFGSPAVSVTWFTILFALLAPLAYPINATSGRGSGDASIRLPAAARDPQSAA